MALDENRGALYVGTAGWSYRDWESVVYPSPRPKEFDPLRYLAGFFNLVELNNTFYRPPSAKFAEKWARTVADRKGFCFTAKLWNRFTHDRETPPGLDDARIFLDGLGPLVDAGRLAGLLVQFPWSFRNTRPNRQRLVRIRDLLPEMKLFLEVRHNSWMGEGALDFVGSLPYHIVSIDQPVFGGSVRPRAVVTGDTAYIRLHGRNREKWFDKNAGRDERYDYLYSSEELTPWIERVRDLLADAKTVYVVTNNHYRGQAPANALELLSRVLDRPVTVPEPLRTQYPHLARFAEPAAR